MKIRSNINIKDITDTYEVLKNHELVTDEPLNSQEMSKEILNGDFTKAKVIQKKMFKVESQKEVSPGAITYSIPCVALLNRTYEVRNLIYLYIRTN